MKKTVPVVVLLLLCIAVVSVNGQTTKQKRQMTTGYTNPQEIVSIDSSVSMDKALEIIGSLSKKFAGKIIIDLEKHKQAIGVTIINTHWRDALETILSHNGLWYDETEEFIRVTTVGSQAVAASGGTAGEMKEPPPTLESRDVKISAAFFTANVSKLQDFGINWNFFRTRTSEPTDTVRISAGIGRADTAKMIFDNALAHIVSPPTFSFANIDALVKFFGTNSLGEVLTGPEVTVKNGKKGHLMVGKTIYVTTRDFQGNTVNQPVEAGTIIDVTPVMYTQNDTDFVSMQITIEQSDVAPGPVINKNRIETFAILYDGEETVIGGLFTTLDQTVREGIPYLKDLPPWFFGLRYLFGSESITKTKQELIVLLKVELLKPVRSRIAEKETRDKILERERKKFQAEYEKK